MCSRRRRYSERSASKGGKNVMNPKKLSCLSRRSVRRNSIRSKCSE